MTLYLGYVSVNGGQYRDCKPFETADEIKDYVPEQFRGLSSFWQCRVLNEAGDVLECGFRAGPNGTGDQWVWRPADALVSTGERG
jgi:hypothetical protein